MRRIADPAGDSRKAPGRLVHKEYLFISRDDGRRRVAGAAAQGCGRGCLNGRHGARLHQRAFGPAGCTTDRQARCGAQVGRAGATGVPKRAPPTGMASKPATTPGAVGEQYRNRNTDPLCRRSVDRLFALPPRFDYDQAIRRQWQRQVEMARASGCAY